MSQNSKYIRYVSVVKECNPRVVIVTKTNEETLGKHFSGFRIQIEIVEISRLLYNGKIMNIAKRKNINVFLFILGNVS